MKNFIGLKLETRNSKLSRALVIACLALIFVSTTNAQVATGTPPFSSVTGGPEAINLANLNFHWDFGVLSKAGRGIPFNYSLGFDNSVWQVVNINGQDTWQPVDVNTMGWTRQTEALTGFATYSTLPAGGNPPCGTYYYNWVYHDPAGTAHTFSAIHQTYSFSCPGVPHTETAGADDGSGYVMTVDGTPSAIIYPPSGGSISLPLQNGTGAAQITDTNGNFISTTDGVTFTDTPGKNVLNITNSGGGTAFPTGYHYQASGGDTQVWLSYTPYNIQTNFGCSGIAEYGPTQIWLVTAIHYPDGSSYTLEYEDTPSFAGNKTGRLHRVTLPTGGTITYDYWGGGGALNGFFCDGTTAAFHRSVNDGSSAFQTDFWRAENGNGTGSTHIIHNNPSPQPADETVVNFSGTFETQRQIYQGPAPPTSGGTLLKTVLTCYNNNFTDCANATVTGPITRKIFYDIFPTGLWDAHDRSFNDSGLLSEADDYDFVMGSFGAPTRRELITYATNLGNIVDRPSSVIVEDGASPPHVLEQTNYGYDDYSVYGLVLTDSNTPTVPQHKKWWELSGSRGNLTSISRLVTGATFLTTKFTYFDTGVISTTIDVNGAVTSYNYPTSDPSDTTCGFTFPNSVSPPTVNGITLTTSTTWNCDGGVAVTTTDPNLNSKSVTSWDSNFWRPTQVKDELLNATNISYISSTVTESSFTFNGSNSTITTRATRDGLGRTHIVQRKQSPTATNYDSVETDYNSYGLPSRQTIAYVGTAGQNYCSSHGLPSTCIPAGTSTTYDALGRPNDVTAPDGLGVVSYSYTNNDVLIEIKPVPTGSLENTKKRQYEYDALGRLTSVCEVTSGSGSGNCAQNNSKTGYWTKYSYDGGGRLTNVTQNAQAAAGSQQTHSFSYDNLGRILSENNPETGATTYTYDSAAGCGTYTGDLVTKSDANGNVICNFYDALHRLTQVSYSGPAAGVTPMRVFTYDAFTLGQPLQNAKGRLARATTCFSPCTIVTDLAYSYSKRGEITDAYEYTQHSGGGIYYHIIASYWEHGALKNWTMPGVPMITYGATDGTGLDGEGRITKVNAATGQNPVTGVTYVTSGTTQPIGALTGANFGSLDSDQFTYDVNTGRLTNYTFNVGSNPVKTDIGTLTWNANGSLKQLAIADTVTGAIDTQTCNYTHDDLGRIASLDCGNTTWQQNFSYDPFGNITKTVPTGGTGVSFQPSYSNPPTNRITSTGYVYDNGAANGNGNLTNDTIHAYSWDAEGRPVCIDGIVMTYDAMGRAVEQATGGTCASPGTSYKQIVYSPGGGKLTLMNAQTLVKAFVPLPGGATAVYTPSGLTYYRHSDHLGSSRLATTPSRTPYFTGAYAPFGENYKENGTTDRSFTGQNQDTVSGLYDFMYRRYSPNQGRWISPDPAGLAAVDMTNPQSWNRYAYVRNGPLTGIDPLGLFCLRGHCPGDPKPDDPSGDYSSGWEFYGDLNDSGQAPGIDSGGSGGGSDVPGRPTLRHTAPRGCPSRAASAGIGAFLRFENPVLLKLPPENTIFLYGLGFSGAEGIPGLKPLSYGVALAYYEAIDSKGNIGLLLTASVGGGLGAGGMVGLKAGFYGSDTRKMTIFDLPGYDPAAYSGASFSYGFADGLGGGGDVDVRAVDDIITHSRADVPISADVMAGVGWGAFAGSLNHSDSAMIPLSCVY